MKAVGEMLREERKRQSMSIEDVMSLTKVSRRHIEALENGSITDLPHPVYVKGFLKVYAELLGLEYKKLLPAVDDAYASLGLDPSDSEPHSRPSERISLNPPKRSGFATRLLVILLVLAVLGAAGYYGYKYYLSMTENPAGSSSTSELGTVVPAGAPAVVESTTIVAEETVTASSEPVAAAGQPEEGSASMMDGNMQGDGPVAPQESVSAASESQSAESAPVADAASETPASDVQNADAIADSANEPVANAASPNIVIIPESARQAPSSKIKVLQVIANGQCWIEAKVDAELTTDFYVRKGERVDIKFQENLAVKFGNMGAVSLRYNDKPYTTTIPANGVKTLVFPPPSS